MDLNCNAEGYQARATRRTKAKLSQSLAILGGDCNPT